ncbi:MAG: type I-MYXAN CRISPR-associated protein Cas6/Cmx6 [Betaproteobacteria bacterium]|nr:type I-MYXAN CRISPR-associated protein Cas6/Cmx6 [Betaproteobacteria bacterium]
MTAVAAAPAPAAIAVDVAFDVAGTSVPADHAWALLQEVEALLPWLADEPAAGIHPLRTAPTTYGVALLAQRTKLVLRVPEARLPDALALAGAVLDVGGSRLAVGNGQSRALRPSATLSAQRVASAAAEVGAFEAEVAQWLAALRIGGRYIAGRPRHGRAGDREIAGFALALHGLSAADSLRIQSEGMGPDRRAGWGLFVPAKAITATAGA